MSEKKRPTHTSGADPGPEQIKDPQAGLDRLKDVLRHLLKVPKSPISGDKEKRRG